MLDDIEMALDGPSFTTTTLARFHDEGFTPSQIFFIVGADAFAEIATWRDYPHVLDAANFVVIARPGLTASSLAERLPDTDIADARSSPTCRTRRTHRTRFLSC